MNKKWVTAGELIEKLNSDPEHQRVLKEKEAERKKLWDGWNSAARPFVESAP